MRKVWQLTLAGILLCALVAVPLFTGCQLEETLPSPVPPPRDQGVLNLWDTGPITLDPAISSELTSHAYVMQISSGLICLDNELKPAPDIAESWQRSSDGKTYTFHLRKGTTFHDGKEVTAQDFKYSWERACNPATGSQTAATYLGDIIGTSNVLEGKATEISGVKVVDNYTLEVTIDAPKAYFLAKLAYPTAFVVDKTNVESGKEWWHKPNGTGPFKLKEWRQGELLVLESNDHYYRQPTKINQVVFHLLAGMPMAMYETNQIDVAPVHEYYVDRARDQNGPFYKELKVFPELSLFYVGFNTQKPPFDDVNIRRAFCHTVNRERIIEIILKGMMSKADNILPPNMPGYNENLRGLSYDTTRAKSFITNSKYGTAANLPPITLTTSGWGGNIPEYLGAIIQDWQQNLGVEIAVRQLEPEVFSYYIMEEADNMFISGWIADYPDPQNFLDILFHTGAEYNTGNYSNPDLDNLLKQAAVESDNTARLALYQQAEQLLLDEAACLPLWFGTNYVLVKPYVKNYEINAMGIPTLSKVSIEEDTHTSP